MTHSLEIYPSFDPRVLMGLISTQSNQFQPFKASMLSGIMKGIYIDPLDPSCLSYILNTKICMRSTYKYDS